MYNLGDYFDLSQTNVFFFFMDQHALKWSVFGLIYLAT